VNDKGDIAIGKELSADQAETTLQGFCFIS